MGYILSLDGGGTKLLCLIADATGKLVGEGKGGPTNSNFNTRSNIEHSFQTAIMQALSESGISKEEIDLVYVATPLNPNIVREILMALLHTNVAVRAKSEFALSIFGAIQSEYGGLVQSGTGSFASIRTQEVEHTVGGWGTIIGDEGSGYDIGRKALIETAKMLDGRNPRTMLKDKIYEQLHIHSSSELVEQIYRVEPGVQRTRIGSLCPVVSECAKLEDPIAMGILIDAAEELAILMIANLNQIEVPVGFNVSVAGGVWKAHHLLFDHFSKKVKGAHPQVTVVPPLFEPVVGGILLGLQEIGYPFQDQIEYIKAEFASYQITKYFLTP